MIFNVFTYFKIFVLDIRDDNETGNRLVVVPYVVHILKTNYLSVIS